VERFRTRQRGQDFSSGFWHGTRRILVGGRTFYVKNYP
jgi:hypothetical protein